MGSIFSSQKSNLTHVRGQKCRTLYVLLLFCTRNFQATYMTSRDCPHTARRSSVYNTYMSRNSQIASPTSVSTASTCSCDLNDRSQGGERLNGRHASYVGLKDSVTPSSRLIIFQCSTVPQAQHPELRISRSIPIFEFQNLILSCVGLIGALWDRTVHCPIILGYMVESLEPKGAES